MVIHRLSRFNARPLSQCTKNVDLYIFRFETPPSILIDSNTRQRSAHCCTRHTVPGCRRSIHFRISHFCLCSGNHCRKVGFLCRHSQIASRAEIRLCDKPATEPHSQQPTLAASLSIFTSLLKGNPNFAIAGKHPGLPNFQGGGGAP